MLCTVRSTCSFSVHWAVWANMPKWNPPYWKSAPAHNYSIFNAWPRISKNNMIDACLCIVYRKISHRNIITASLYCQPNSSRYNITHGTLRTKLHLFVYFIQAVYIVANLSTDTIVWRPWIPIIPHHIAEWTILCYLLRIWFTILKF